MQRPSRRARMEALIQRLIDALDAEDAATEDMEPSLGWHDSATSGAGLTRPYAQTDLAAGISPVEAEGDEGDGAEGWLQPTTLAPDWLRPTRGRVIAFPRRLRLVEVMA